MAFDNIVSDDPEYTVTISTELNGRTVTQMVEKFPVGSPQDGDEDATAAAATAAAANEGDGAAGEDGAGGGVVVKEKVQKRRIFLKIIWGFGFFYSSKTLNNFSFNARPCGRGPGLTLRPGI